MSVSVGVDLGKTGCRVGIVSAGGPSHVVVGAGTPGLAEPGGAAVAAQTIAVTVVRALHEADLGLSDVGSTAVGAAGAEAASDSAFRLATELERLLPVSEIAVASDSVVSHIGAFGGRGGAVLAVGTGAVALAVADDGKLFRVDGWGPWLGDDGSGAWIGREALRAVLCNRDQRGPATGLSRLAEQRYGDLAGLPQRIARGGQIARDTAAFVPDVVSCALSGDAQAADILRRASLVLADSTISAARAVGVHVVCAVGGLASIEVLMATWRKALPDDLDVVPALGTALDGAITLACRHDLPHETAVLRVRAQRSDSHLAPARPESNPLDDVAVPYVDDVDVLQTESVRRDLHDLDTRSPEELVALLLEAESSVPRAVTDARDELAQAVRLVATAFERGGRLVYVGAGTPGRLAAVDAAECPPTFGTSPDQVVAVMAGGDAAAAAAVEGAEDDSVAGAADVDALHVTAHDVVVGISASGRTPYVLGALETARRRGARTVAVVNNRGSAAGSLADVTIELLTGPEVLSGSTRLKAGTAQKVTLNALSTSAMICAGKSYGAWMVDVKASNDKLRRRATRIVREATGVDDDEARGVLASCDWHAKVALVAILAGVDVAAARARLDMAHGRVRDAVREQVG